VVPAVALYTPRGSSEGKKSIASEKMSSLFMFGCHQNTSTAPLCRRSDSLKPARLACAHLNTAQDGHCAR